ncbi:hypothetical protein [Marinomonas pontica]|uniref:hypothetical protein n=1 Tax=Marinomonas pontica TaxID=264739 RepID=UPI002ADE6B31|nr:hypothetical protein [Marinomonas pontica]
MIRKDMFLALFIIVAWGFNFIVMRWGLDELTPMMLGGLRFLVIGLIGCFFSLALTPRYSGVLVTLCR